MGSNDLLSRDVVLGQCESGSSKGQERIVNHTKALDAKDKADLDGMFVAYQAAVEDRSKIEEMWMQAYGMTQQKNKSTIDGTHVTAIRDVALAAIELARDVAVNAVKENTSTN